MKRKKIAAITLGIMFLILTMAIGIQIRSINSINSSVVKTLAENNLRDQVLRWKERYDEIYIQTEETEKVLQSFIERTVQDDSQKTGIYDEININNMLLGNTNVKGDGVVVTLQDNSTTTSEILSATDSIEYYLVHDIDIRTIVNELKNAGAEAISINGQRVISTTSITCEGTVIKINGEKVSSPFEIKAIGSPALLYSLARPGGYIELLNSTGVIATIKKTENIVINKNLGVITSKYMTIAE